jgi:hypothetical protein
MKNIIVFSAILICIFSCNISNKAPNVENININISTERFERKLFDTNATSLIRYLGQLQNNDPAFTNNFIQHILGIPHDFSADSTAAIVNEFVKSYRSVYDSVERDFNNFSKYEKEIKHALQYVKYYFPTYKTPEKIITYIGPADGYGDILSPEGFLIGLHHHLGKNYPLYKTEMVQQFYPEYISRRFEPDYIVINCIKNIVNDLYPEKNEDKSLINQMIEKGKRLYLLQKMLPDVDENMLIGYTSDQLKDCNKHEAAIWDLFVKNNLLQTTDKSIIKNYVEEGPKTQELGDGAPGNIGTYTGWQIIKKYIQKNSSLTPAQLMAVDAETIFQETKYKP